MLQSTLIEAARAGAAEILRYFQGEFRIDNKEGVNNLVTEADHASERAILSVIRSAFPDHMILAEESGSSQQTNEYKWIIDPIDGTVNFAHGIPLNAVSIGIEKNEEVIMGVVYNPHLNELFFAEKGKGAFLNDKRIRVSNETKAVKACLVTGFPYTYIDQPNGPLDVFARFVKKGVPVRRIGSAAIDLCWVAAGRFDGFYEHKLEPWDTAAGVLMVREAGGKVTSHQGDSFSIYEHPLLASNGFIHEELVGVLNNTHEL
ncbi:MAG: inositol monophosphatase family protein [Bacteroidota bacterium]